MINVDIKDLAAAYRKVKVDLFYSGNPYRLALADFEENLEDNLQKIKSALKDDNQEYIFSLCKGFWLSPKNIEFEKDSFDKNLIYSAPQHEYNLDKIKSCKLRIIANVPIEFHIITTLWINLVGEKFDKKLSKNSYGNRIRRHKNEKPNLEALGSFNPYLIHYQKWRDNGLKIMRDGLTAEKNIIAVTADFSSFYHNVSSNILLSEDLRNLLGVKFSSDDLIFTKLIVKMLNTWAYSTPIKKGLPVGCSISAVIANVALAELDFAIEQEIVPLYYGRYVDDIILVIENTNKFSSVEQVWSWICKRVDCLKPQENNDDKSTGENIDKKEKNIVFKSRFSTENNCSNIKLGFEQSKTKIFLLEYPSGLGLLDSLEYQIKTRSSEWRALPELPDETKIASMLLAACNKNGEDADNLRKADSLSIRRAMFAMKLRDFEAYCRNLDHICWQNQRRAFLKTVDEYFTNIDSYFELFRYFPRIVSIATECKEYDLLHSILLKIKNIDDTISGLANSNTNNPSQIELEISGEKIEIQHWNKYVKFFHEYMFSGLRESIISTKKLDIKDKCEKLQDIITLLNISKDQEACFDKLMGCDLAYLPLRSIYLHKEMTWSREDKASGILQNYKSCPVFYPAAHFKKLRKISNLNVKQFHRGDIPVAWMFPTRPFNITELYFICQSPFDCAKIFMDFLMVTRGYAKNLVGMPSIQTNDDEQKTEEKNIYYIQKNYCSHQITIALVSWETQEESWTAAACQKIDPDYTRYARITHLLNQILHSRNHIDYVIFPELSIPPRWFLGLALKLKTSGTSLIAGVEYIHNRSRGTKNVYNQVWCSLLHDGLGFRQSVIFKHNKDIPAIHEERELHDVANVSLITENPNHTCDIVRHGEFYFGILICSELTDINYRAKLRGQVDAIFVPEWNSDIEMFSSLVESAAYDVHAYIIQCNNRRYGDTRIRVPAKIHHYRDLVKIKGGEEDFFVVGKLDIDKLRAFQSFNVSPTGNDAPFKPVPAGFRIAKYRKVLPEIIK